MLASSGVCKSLKVQHPWNDGCPPPSIPAAPVEAACRFADGKEKKDSEMFHDDYILPQILQMKTIYCLEENLPLDW